jgi:serine/threonine protein kinase
MPRQKPIGIDPHAPPFDRLKSVERLGANRSGRGSGDHVRHHLLVGYDPPSRVNVLVKLTSKPGLVYEQNLTNEINSLSTINRELPDSRHFPLVLEHGRLPDSRVYLITSLFDELPLATAIGPEAMPMKARIHLETTLAVARALEELHGLQIFHVDLNPMNILYRVEKGAPVIRIVDFESSYERARHSTGAFFSPPTTPGYSAPEVSTQAPDARSDLYSLGAVLYTMLAGHQWTWEGNVSRCVAADENIDAELRGILVVAVDPDPDRRYSSVREFRQVLTTHLEHIWPGRSF